MLDLTDYQANAMENLAERTYDPSCIECFTCPRKGFYAYILKLVSKKNKLCFSFGTAIHLGLEYYRRGEDKEKVLSVFDTYEEDAFDEIRTKAKGRELLSAYMRKYPLSDDSLQVIYLETPFKFELVPGKFLSGRMDEVVSYLDRPYVLDHKTTTWPPTAFFFKQFDPNFQFTAYTVAAKHLLGDCAGVIVDAIYLKGKPNNTFLRQPVNRTPYQVEEFTKTFDFWTSLIELCIKEEYFPLNESKCKDYGGCHYAPLCKHGHTEEVIEAFFDTQEEAFIV